MNLKNTSDSYGFISKNFHWILAILLLSNFFLGFIMVELERGPLKSSIYGFHKSTGILLLILIILRLFWRSINITPIPVANNKLLNRLAKSVHLFFYFFVCFDLSPSNINILSWDLKYLSNFRHIISVKV